MKIAIIGAGVMGCATARVLAKRGAEVVLLERAIPGAEASSAAAGILGAQLEMQDKGAPSETYVRARRDYAALAQELKEETGIDVGYRVCGALCAGRSEEEHAALAKAVAWQRDAKLSAELLDAAKARAIEPSLSDSIVCAAHYPDEAQVDPPSLLRALVASLARSDRVAIRSGTTVARLILENDRCVGVALDDGEVRADATVLAAGSWASLVPGLPSSVPAVRPARGQIVQLDERPPRLRSIVFAGHSYAVPRGDGRVLCGSTVEMVGFKREVTAGGVHAILSGVLATLPSLASAAVSATWSSFRPHTDGEPLVGASSLPGLFLATGHFRNGILLANETARAVADAITR